MIKKYHEFLIPALFFIGLALLSAWPYVNMVSEPHDAQRFISSLLIAVALIISLWLAKLSVTLLWAICAVYLWGVLAVWFSPLPFWSSIEFAMLFSVALLCISLFPKVDALLIKHLAVIFVLLQAFYLSQNLTYYIAIMLTSNIMVPHTLATGFSNIRFYGQFLIWTVPFILGMLSLYPELKYRNLVLFVLALDWAYQFLTGTRAFIFATFITIPVVWVFGIRYKQQRNQYIKWLLVTAFAGFLIYLCMQFIVPSLSGVSISSVQSSIAQRSLLTSSARTLLWQEALKLISTHPWMGAGPMMTAMLVPFNISAHPHNFVLQLLAEWGIPFAGLILFLMAIGIFKWVKMAHENSFVRVPLALPIVASLFAGLAAGFVDGLLVMPVSLVYLTVIVGLLAGLWRAWTPDDVRIRFPKWLMPIFVAPAIYVAAYAISMWPERNVIVDMRQPIQGRGYHNILDYNPRFWVDGHIILDEPQNVK